MALQKTASDIWHEIEQSESYLVCSMFEKAASRASSVLESIINTSSATSIEDIQLADMMESAGMVLVQSLQELGRTSELLKQLKTLFGSVTNIPIQVLLTGACFQISDGSYSGPCEFLSEFLSKWRYVDGHSYKLVNAEQKGDCLKGCSWYSTLEINKYLEIVEIYCVTLLAGLLNNNDLATAWVEKAELPEENRQDLLRRLRSLYSLKATKSSQSEETHLLAHKDQPDFEMNSTRSGALSRKETMLRFTERVEPCFWWFRTVSLKFGSARLVFSHGKIALWGSFIIFICFILQKKRASLKQIASKQASSIKKALIDLWQLAFSVQVNPLAAVQPLPAAGPRGSRGG